MLDVAPRHALGGSGRLGTPRARPASGPEKPLPRLLALAQASASAAQATHAKQPPTPPVPLRPSRRRLKNSWRGVWNKPPSLESPVPKKGRDGSAKSKSGSA